jgi:short-subunit dehydrogenase
MSEEISGRTAVVTGASEATAHPDRRDEVGLNGWSEALRRELLPDVRVTVVEPGAVDTELTDLIRPSRQPL